MRNLNPWDCIEFWENCTACSLRPDAITDADIDAALEEGTADFGELSEFEGVYLLVNDATKRIYAGRAKNIKRRVQRHISALKHGRHDNFLMTKDCADYGIEWFRAALLTHTIDAWSWLAEMKAIKLIAKRDTYNVQLVDFLGRANFTETGKAYFAQALSDSPRPWSKLGQR